MKIRNGFVSNSSSSSFLISVPNNGRDLQNIKSELEKQFINDMKEYCRDCETSNNIDKIYKFIENEFNKGNQVVYFTVDSEDDSVSVLETFLNKINGKIVEEEEIYNED